MLKPWKANVRHQGQQNRAATRADGGWILAGCWLSFPDAGSEKLPVRDACKVPGRNTRQQDLIKLPATQTRVGGKGTPLALATEDWGPFIDACSGGGGASEVTYYGGSLCLS